TLRSFARRNPCARTQSAKAAWDPLARGPQEQGFAGGRSEISSSSARTLAFSLLLGLATACGAGEEDGDGTDTVTPGVGAGDTTPWAGQTFILSIPEANWSEPMGLGAEIGPFVTPFLIRIDDAAGNVTLTT